MAPPLRREHSNRFSQPCSTRLSQRSYRRETSGYLRVSLSTLRRWRKSDGGPGFIRFGKSIRYRVQDWTDSLATPDQGVLCEIRQARALASAPAGLRSLTPCGLSLCEHRVYFFTIPSVVCQENSTEAVTLGSNLRILCKLVSREQGESLPPGLEEYDAFSPGH